ncbi:MAG TPA: folylpolyglutamate synthase/dihydrofolate synthase family protein [Pyrinomonadaceae bacterium]
MLFDEALQYLLSLGHETLAIKLGLKNIGLLLGSLGHPQASFIPVQIAGTNGKGSTAVMLDSIARAAGVRCGLYTSPHLARITERIKINGQEIAPDDFARLATRVRLTSESLRHERAIEALPTFFEQVTAIALLAFKEAGVQLAILETGLGGRLDATTAAGARLVGITPIALDHQEYLGATLAEIAFEKAAIIGPGVEAVVAPQDPEALEVIEKRCAEMGVAPHFAGSRVEITGASDSGHLRVTFETEEGRYSDVRLGLRGRHQVVNAAVAVSLAERLRALGSVIPRPAITEGIESAEHAGRLELWQGKPRILFDGAHNVASARAFLDYLREFVHVPVTLVFGAMRDKELAEMAQLLFPAARRLILAGMSNPRAAQPEMLQKIAPRGFDSESVSLAPSPHDAARMALKLTPPEGLIAVTGSLYLVGEMRELLSSKVA